MQIVWFTYSYGNIFISNIGRIWYNIPSFLADLGRCPISYVIRRINLYEHYEDKGRIVPRYDEVSLQEEIFKLCDNFTLEAFNKIWAKSIEL